MSCEIRDITRADIDRVGEILYEGFTAVAANYGYTPIMRSAQEGKSWAWAMFYHGSSEGLAAVVENRVVGVIYLNRRGDAGGAGPEVVDLSFQRTDIAAKLMSAMLERAEGLSSVRAVQEAFNTTSFTFQYKFDFMPVADLLDLYLNGKTRERVDLNDNVSELAVEDLDAICAYDTPRSKFDRRKDLVYFCRWGKVFVYRNRSEIRGYLACLPGSGAVQLGPLLAEGEGEAECLFRHALALFEGKTCRTRVMARDSLLVKALMKLGFRLYCMAFLTVRGAWRPSRYIEAFGRFPEGV